MKKILFILSLFASFFANSQTGVLGSNISPIKLKYLIGSGQVKYIGTRTFEGAVLEPTIVPVGDSVYIYYTGTFNDTTHRIGLIRVANIEDTWPVGDSVVGRGLASPADRSASSSDIVYDGTSFYMYALDGYGFTGDTKNVYLYTSTDGRNWVDGGVVFTIGLHAGETITNFGNTGVLKNINGPPAFVGGKYRIVTEGRVGASWQSFHAESSSLTSGWTITQKLPTLEPIPGSTYGGNCVKYFGGNWHTFYHYSTVGPTLPCNLAYATSPDGLNWTIREVDYLTYYSADPSPPTPPTEADLPYPFTDQVADIWVEEINGKVYILAEFVDNSYITGRIESQIWIWKYNGTFASLVRKMGYN